MLMQVPSSQGSTSSEPGPRPPILGVKAPPAFAGAVGPEATPEFCVSLGMMRKGLQRHFLATKDSGSWILLRMQVQIFWLLQQPKCTLIAGTNPFAVGSWRQIWARDVAFLHFSQTASLRSHNGREMLTNHISSEHFSRTARPKGGGLGKMKKSDISAPNLPPGTNTRSVGSCDQIRH